MMRQWKLALATSIAVASICLPAMAADKKLNVIASFSILGDMAQKVGGDRIELRTLVGPNGDAHVYEPKPSDAIAMAKADVVLVNGLQLEGFLSRLVEASETKAVILEATKGANILRDPHGGHYHYYGTKAVFHEAPFDPHAWQSVGNAKVYVQNIADAFCAADANGCDTYKQNASAYKADLDKLDTEIKNTVGSIPQEKRVVVVAHNAFRYFENDYGIKFLSPQGSLRNLKRQLPMLLAWFVISNKITLQQFSQKILPTPGLSNKSHLNPGSSLVVFSIRMPCLPLMVQPRLIST